MTFTVIALPASAVTSLYIAFVAFEIALVPRYHWNFGVVMPCEVQSTFVAVRVWPTASEPAITGTGCAGRPVPGSRKNECRAAADAALVTERWAKTVGCEPGAS